VADLIQCAEVTEMTCFFPQLAFNSFSMAVTKLVVI